MREKALKDVRLLHSAFLLTIFLFIFIAHTVAFGERPVAGSVVAAIACVAVADPPVGFFLRRQYMGRAAQAVTVENDEAKALRIWRLASIVSFAHAEAVALVGFLLKFLGTSWQVAGPFFFAAFALLLLWTPRLDLPTSASENRSAVPAPPAL